MAPNAADTARARDLARRGLRRSLRATDRFTWGVTAVVVGWSVWLVVQTVSAIQLQNHGVRTSARIDRVVDGKASAITVDYPASAVYVSIPLWFGAGRYMPGGRVEIAYQRTRPSHAVLAHGLPTPGGWTVAGPLLIVGGLTVIAAMLYGRRGARRIGAIIDSAPSEMLLTTHRLESSDDVGLTLDDERAAIGYLGHRSRKGAWASIASRPVLVFGTLTLNSLVYAVDLQNRAAVFGRLRDLSHLNAAEE